MSYSILIYLFIYFLYLFFISMYKLQYFVCTVLGISTANLLVVVERKRSSSIYQSIDEFTNPYNDTSFCSLRNASCGGVPCTHCSCNTKTVFYSYLHGCKSKMEIEKILKVKLVTFSVRNDIIPLVGEDTLNSCVSFSLPIDGVTDCNLGGMYFINIVTGGIDFQFMDYFELVRNTTRSLCLKYTASKRDLAKAYGMLVKLPLQCKDGNSHLTIPFLMTIEGVYVDNSKTFPTQKTVTTTERTFVTNSPTTVTTEALVRTISTTISTNVSPSVRRETSAAKTETLAVTTETSFSKSTTTLGWITSSKTEVKRRMQSLSYCREVFACFCELANEIKSFG
ncbi:uncharacterized protein LOC130626090 [Hydractinia symbiolongicarpus]|uniref:uncharacterized protein LOC130626085 n=1 Tax=Hydractinia symbiolongicarpus TaxID=13093 RepID=UPI0025518495|nr:uncharacterized protein LOC130626085 [Hydractinia symbiolongicarpus]XP_057297180.1 uncharacterized protein LOC130626090 [Hydractinia symbiolongicarpus]